MNVLPTQNLAKYHPLDETQNTNLKPIDLKEPIDDTIHFHDSFAPQQALNRPLLDPPEKVKSGVLGLIGVVDRVEEMKKRLQEFNFEQIENLSRDLHKNSKDLKESEALVKANELKMKYLNAARNVLIFSSGVYALFSANGWGNMGAIEKIITASTLAISALNIGVLTLEHFELVKANYNNLLNVLQLIALGATIGSRLQQQQLATLSRIISSSGQIVDILCGIYEGKVRYDSQNIKNEHLALQNEMKKNQTELQAIFFDMQMVEKKHKIDTHVASMIHEMQEITKQIQRPI